MRSSNPAMQAIAQSAGSVNFGGQELAATMSGSIYKSIFAVVLTFVVAALTFSKVPYIVSSVESLNGYVIGSVIVAFIVALITIFKPSVSPITTPIYAVVEGFALGVLSFYTELMYPGIVSTAVISTFCVVLSMLVLWKFRIVVPTQKFRSIITGAVCGIALLYIVNMLVSIFTKGSLLPTQGPLAIGISLIICAVAAFSLILDFQNIEDAVNMGLPKYFEYYNAFSLLVTICWLYIEILKLLRARE